MAKWGSWQDNTRKEQRGDVLRIETYYTCSECGAEGYEDDKYCHCCGADMYYSPPQTNADRIRAMSDEELAKFIPDWSYTGACKCGKHYVECNNECGNCVIEWLKQPAEEVDDG